LQKVEKNDINKNIMKLTKFTKLTSQQKKQVLLQWKKHQHKKILRVKIPLSGHGELLNDFLVFPKVWNPIIVSARYHASYLFYNNERLFAGKKVLDMGCGTGLMAIVMGLHGSKQVIASDISLSAVKNTEANVKKFKINKIVKVIQGNLFENISGKFDFITFMQPYFGDNPPHGDTIAASMLDSGNLIKIFLEQVPKYLNTDGIIMMPFYSKAGETNNPMIQGPKYGFKVSTTFQAVSGTGLQTGEISIHELSFIK